MPVPATDADGGGRHRPFSSSNFSGAIPPPILELSHHDSLSWARNGATDAHRARHRTEYQVLRTLGRGAFGTTFQVRNRVDSRLYAMKCVRLVVEGGGRGPRGGGCGEGFDSEDCRKVLREVEVLSGLRSDNIVRYYSAWVERAEMSDVVAGGGDGGGSSADGGRANAGGGSAASSSGEWTDESTRPSADDGESSTAAAAAAAAAHPHPVCNLCHSPYKDWEVSFEHWGLIDAVLQPLDLCTDCYRKSVPPSVDASSISIREKRVLDEYLFILMEYCEMTLSEAAAECRRRRTAEEEEEEDDDDRCDARLWSLFGQCVRGLAHLHSRGVVHRDIKPTNIFVLDGVAKIGDMGLATYSEGGGGGGGDSSSSSDVGTYLYMAPETKGGSYSDKSDVFALGVVLVETFSDFSTGMERAVVLEKFRADGTLPSDWEARRPVQADLARRMAAADPSARPSSGQILGELLREGLLGEQPDPAALVDAVTDLHEQLKTMQLKLQRIGEENSELRQLLDERGISHGHVGHINGSNSVGSKQRIKGC